jgi:hypothetical protein
VADKPNEQGAGFQWGLTMSLTKGRSQVGVDLIKRVIRVRWRGFQGEDPG